MKLEKYEAAPRAIGGEKTSGANEAEEFAFNLIREIETVEDHQPRIEVHRHYSAAAGGATALSAAAATACSFVSHQHLLLLYHMERFPHFRDAFFSYFAFRIVFICE